MAIDTEPTKYEMPRFDTPNKRVAVEPFPQAPKAEVKGGVVMPQLGAALVPLKVIFPSYMLEPGYVVYVRSKLATTTSYAKEVFEVEGRKFVLLPFEDVVLVDRRPQL